MNQIVTLFPFGLRICNFRSRLQRTEVAAGRSCHAWPFPESPTPGTPLGNDQLNALGLQICLWDL